jgi:hypothetical protein
MKTLRAPSISQPHREMGGKPQTSASHSPQQHAQKRRPNSANQRAAPLTSRAAASETNSALYRTISRCSAFTWYPAFIRRTLISSAIITLRCCPPVQPNATVK